MKQAKNRFVIILFFLTPFIIQASTTDSLISSLNKAKTDSAKFLIYEQLFFTNEFSDTITAKKYLIEALSYAEKTNNTVALAKVYLHFGFFYEDFGFFERSINSYEKSANYSKQINDKKGIAKAYGNAGLVFWKTGNYKKSIEYQKTALRLNTEINNKEGIARDLGNIGIVYYIQGYNPEALDYYFRALKIDEELKNYNGIGRHLGNIGGVYYDLKEYPKALEYYQKALHIAEKHSNKNEVARHLGNIGIVLNIQKKHQEALEYNKRAIKVLEELGDKTQLAGEFGNIATTYGFLGNNELSLEYDLKALAINTEINYANGIILSLMNVSNHYADLKKNALAEAYAKKAVKIADSIKSVEMQCEAEKILSEFYQRTNQPILALEHYKKHTVLKDSLFNAESTKKSIRSEMNFQFEKKQAADSVYNLEQMKHKQLIHEQQIQEQKIYTYTGLLGFILMLLIAGISFRAYKQKQKANHIINEQKLIVEEKQKEILDSIHYAQRIQKALLASDYLLKSNLPEHFVLFKPKDIVSGDFYWAIKKEESFYLATCDSTGHGVPGAFMSLLNISYLNEAITERGIDSPNEIFNHVRKQLIENVSQDGGQDGMDGILFQFDFENCNLNYAASNNSFYHIRNNELIIKKADKMPVGKSLRDSEPFKHYTIDLQKGDILYALTDGYADQFGGPDGKKFKYKKLENLLLEIHSKPLPEQKSILNNSLEQWKGNLEQVDDILIIGIKV